MPECPKCKAKVESLRLFEKGETEYRFELDGTGDPQKLIQMQICDDDPPQDFECPECNKVLFKDWDEATAFLKGGK